MKMVKKIFKRPIDKRMFEIYNLFIVTDFAKQRLKINHCPLRIIFIGQTDFPFYLVFRNGGD